MFDRSADLYDAIYDALGKDYEAEAQSVLQRVESIRGSTPSTLLDVACGTGRHLEHFGQLAGRVGLDIEPGLLEVARERCPDVRFVEGDMVEFSLGARFDCVVCLFSAIGYVATPDRLKRAIACMADHLAPGGVLLVEPSFDPDRWSVGSIQVVVAEKDGAKAVRMMRSGRTGDVATLEAHYLVQRPDRIEHLTEEHKLGLFRTEAYLSAVEAAGLEVSFDPEGLIGRGLIIGVHH